MGNTAAVSRRSIVGGEVSKYDNVQVTPIADVSGGSCSDYVACVLPAKICKFGKSRDRNVAPGEVSDPGWFSRPLPHRLPIMIEEVEKNDELSDEHIDHAQGLLRKRFSNISGFLSVSVLSVIPERVKVKLPGSKFVQIFHLPERHHWICGSNLRSQNEGTVVLYDSSIRTDNPVASFDLQTKLAAMLDRRQDVIVEWADVKGQENAVDCGLHAIASAVALCNGLDPAQADWQLDQMRPHLVTCFRESNMTPFPVGQSDRNPRSAISSTIRIRCLCHLPVSDRHQKNTWICSACGELYHRKCVANLIEVDEPFYCDICLPRT